jgi:cytochrome bd-type quinol oxidase subunit 2
MVAALCGPGVIMLTSTRWQAELQVRMLAAAGVASVIWGWGVAQFPTLLPGTTLTLSNAGAPHATLVALVVVFIIAVVLVAPSFVLLFTLKNRRLLSDDQEQIASDGKDHDPSRGRSALVGRSEVFGCTPATRWAPLHRHRHRSR